MNNQPQNIHHKINYVEFPAKNMYRTKMFFSKVFAWKFQDYGNQYCAFFDAGINGGFFKSNVVCSTQKGSVLLVLYSNSLNKSLLSIEPAGGKIIKPVFEFPGGKRFHFSDPNGNEFALWSDK